MSDFDDLGSICTVITRTRDVICTQKGIVATFMEGEDGRHLKYTFAPNFYPIISATGKSFFWTF